MRKIAIDNIKPGQRLARSIFSVDGRIFLAQGAVLKESYINKLRKNGIMKVYIDESAYEDINSGDFINEATRIESRALVKDVMNSYVFKRKLNINKVNRLVDDIIDELLDSETIVGTLSRIKTLDEYAFSHSVNVCVLSLIMGIELNYEKGKLQELGVGAILHDIGKLYIDKKLIRKPTQLTNEEFEEIKKHTVYGYEILQNHANISSSSAIIALSHHERYDGSGYPLHLKGENIHEFARIVAIADVYDALTSDRTYRKGIKPHEVLNYITNKVNKQFDKKIINSFVKHIAMYPNGTQVLLNTGERCVVASQNNYDPCRPIVRVVLDRYFRPYSKYFTIDLSKEKDTFIVNTCKI